MNNFSKLENIFLEEERKVSCNTSHPTVGRIEITAINSNGWGTYKMYEGFSTFIAIGSRSISSLINSYKQRIIQDEKSIMNLESSVNAGWTEEYKKEIKSSIATLRYSIRKMKEALAELNNFVEVKE